MSIVPPIHICSFYKFCACSEEELETRQAALEAVAEETRLRGLVIIAQEGVNGTVSGSETAISAFKKVLENEIATGDWVYKDSLDRRNPYRRFKVKIRPEIVTSGTPELVGKFAGDNYLTAEQWHEKLLNDKDVVVVDVRNDYETELGVFEGAIDPKLDNFQEFPEYIQKAELPKDKEILLYCTGGIRCEKAVLEMQHAGYDKVYHLYGGILRYLEEYPEGCFDGECFVFDHRVAVDSKLEPSRTFGLCPHCGDPGSTRIQCTRCGSPGIICDECGKSPEKQTCSKDCRNQLLRLWEQEAEGKKRQVA